jgi:hypothetical protein
MYLKLPATFVDPKTQAPLPGAVLLLTDAQFALRAGDVKLQLAVYATAAAATAGREPISEVSVALSPGEIAVQQPALMQACFAVLLARPEFAGAALVTP